MELLHLFHSVTAIYLWVLHIIIKFWLRGLANWQVFFVIFLILNYPIFHLFFCLNFSFWYSDFSQKFFILCFDFVTLKIFCYHLTEDCCHYFFSYFSKTCFEKQILMDFTHLQSIDSFTYPSLKHYTILFLNFAWHLYFLFVLISYFWFLCKLNETPTETFHLSDFFIWQVLFPLAS